MGSCKNNWVIAPDANDGATCVVIDCGNSPSSIQSLIMDTCTPSSSTLTNCCILVVFTLVEDEPHNACRLPCTLKSIVNLVKIQVIYPTSVTNHSIFNNLSEVNDVYWMAHVKSFTIEEIVNLNPSVTTPINRIVLLNLATIFLGYLNVHEIMLTTET